MIKTRYPKLRREGSLTRAIEPIKRVNLAFYDDIGRVVILRPITGTQAEIADYIANTLKHTTAETWAEV